MADGVTKLVGRWGRLSNGWGILWWMLLTLGSGMASATEVAVVEAQGRWVEATYWVETRLSLELPAVAKEALRNGVALTLALELEVLADGGQWWQDKRLERRWLYRLSYHTLAQVYQVVSEQEGVLRNYASLAQALLALGLVESLPAFKREELKPGDYRARLRVRLVTEDLPLPLRLQSYLSSDWLLESPWYDWRVSL